MIESLGEGLARIHHCRETYVGNPSGTFQLPLHDFHRHLIKSVDVLVSTFHSENEKIVKKRQKIIEQLQTVTAPEYSTFVLVDMDPSQFLSNQKEITGLVDTEAYVIAPRELDFIGLEYILDDQQRILNGDMKR